MKLPRRKTSKTPRDLFRAAGILKTIKRKGWTKVGIEDGESVADHSFRMAIIGAYLSIQMKLDHAKVTRMCLIHDLAESKIGDLTPEEKISEEAHRKDEDTAIESIFDTLPEVERKTFQSDWKELLSMETEESKLVWQIDKLEMGLTMKDYIGAGCGGKKLKQFDSSSRLSRQLRSLLEKY